MCWIFVKRTYLRVCWRSTIDLCLMNLPKRSSFKSLLKVYTMSKILLWIKLSYFSLENACYSWCMHQTGLFSSASVVPQSKSRWYQAMLITSLQNLFIMIHSLNRGFAVRKICHNHSYLSKEPSTLSPPLLLVPLANTIERTLLSSDCS